MASCTLTYGKLGVGSVIVSNLLIGSFRDSNMPLTFEEMNQAVRNCVFGFRI